MQALVGCGCVEVQMVTGRAAPEATVDLLLEVGREAPAPGRCRPMHRACAAHFFAGGFSGHEAQKPQNLCHGDTSADFLKVDARHDDQVAQESLYVILPSTDPATEKRSP